MGSSELAGAARSPKTSVRAPLLGLASPSEYDRGRPAEALSGDSAFPGVSAPSALAEAGTHCPGICLVPVRVRLQGFSPSGRVSSPASFRPVKAGDAHGVLPFEAFPFGGAAMPLDTRCPPVVTRTRRTQPKTTCGRLASPTSGPCSPPESVTIARGLVVRPFDAPLGFRRSRAFRVRVASGFPATPLSGFRHVRLAPRRPASQGLDPLSRCCAPRSKDRWEPQPFCDFRTSFPFRVLRAAASRARAERFR